AVDAHDPGEQQDGEENVEAGAGEQHHDALEGVLAREGPRQVLGRHRAFALVEELHVAAERNGRDGDLRAVRAQPPGLQRLAEADREPENLEAETARNPEVAELVNGDQESDRDDEPQRVPDDAHARAPSSERPPAAREPPSMRSHASRLASASAASTSSRQPIAPAGQRVTT